MKTPRPCWICGDPADTDEHRRKRSDLVARYGASWTPEQQPFVIRGDGSSRWTRIQGPNDRRNLYERMLCGPCNNARTQPFDQAYQQFSGWVLVSAATLHEKDAIDFADIFGDAFRENSSILCAILQRASAVASLTPTSSRRQCCGRFSPTRVAQIPSHSW